MIQKADSLEIKKKCITFYQKIWSDDLEKQNDIQYFLYSDIFYIKSDNNIIAVIELFIKNKEKDYYKNRYDFTAIEGIKNNNFVYLSRLATAENYRKKGYAGELLKYVFKYYKHKGIENIFTTLEDYNFSFYEKYGFKQSGGKIIIKDYECYNFQKEL